MHHLFYYRLQYSFYSTSNNQSHVYLYQCSYDWSQKLVQNVQMELALRRPHSLPKCHMRTHGYTLSKTRLPQSLHILRHTNGNIFSILVRKGE